MNGAADSPSARIRRWVLMLAVVGGVVALAIAIFLANPMPPSSVVMATGAQGGAYAAVGERYREVLARNGVHLELRPSNGSVDNVALLRDARSGVRIALVQGGITSESEAPELVSLGTLFYEPFWVFSRFPATELAAKLSSGVRLSLGARGSGTYKLGHEIAAAVGLDPFRVKIEDLDTSSAVDALLKGDLDIIAVVLAWGAPALQRLLADPSIHLIDWRRADAQVALRPYLSKLVLPRGIVDLAHDRPPQDIALVAAKASLVVRKDLHPALQYLLLQAASELHGGAGVFHKAGQFPAAEPIDLPLSEYARDYYRNGRPFLERQLPFWLAAITSQLLLLLIPLIAVLYPLLRVLPAVYDWAMRSRIFRMYGELKVLETDFERDSTAANARALIERLARLEDRVGHMRVPVSFASLLYTLKQHIQLVRARLVAAQLDHEQPHS
jgi:TRAP-type uncharacterized transport system substrate-binding protein